MKILYGVQGTGNGHLSRARAMARALQRYPEIDIDWLISGRPPEQVFDMELFGDYRWHRGLTFATQRGRVKYWRTAVANSPRRFWQDCRSLDVSPYDIIVSDFEPVTAWAARLNRRQLIGLGHQYAFDHDIPKAGGGPLSSTIMRNYAPADIAVGLHWHHFGQNILPPIADMEAPGSTINGDGPVLVYLPFEEPADIVRLLSDFCSTRFLVYHPLMSDHAAPGDDLAHIATRALSARRFKDDLRRCAGVVCSAGFELIAEALMVGKKILAKPLAGQMEQLSNALALRRLGYGSVMTTLDGAALGDWLKLPGQRASVRWPDVAGSLASWLATGCDEDVSSLSVRLWLDAELHSYPQFGGGLDRLSECCWEC